MTEPRIQYVQTEDGVRIAYTVMGEGPPLTYDTGYPFTHFRALLGMGALRTFFERLASARSLILFDHRGTGSSQRDRLPESKQDLVTDLEAVLSRIAERPVAISGFAQGGEIGARYVIGHPEEVSHLVLIDSAVRPFDVPARMQGLFSLSQADYELFCETAARVYWGWEGEAARQAARILQEAASPAAMARFLELREDLTEIYSRVRAPTVLLKHDQAPVPTMDMAIELTSLIPEAELVVLEGSWITTDERGIEAADAIIDFIGAGAGSETVPSTRTHGTAGTLQTVLFTDLVGHTEMMSRLGDSKGRDVLREHERITREVLAAHGGTEVKTMGDGFMASFGSVTKAVECAISLQRAFAEREGEPLSVRVGLNAGEPIEEEGDLFGTTVILASRIAAKAEGGEILVSDNVRSLSAGKGFLFSDRGEFVAKGFEEPVSVYEVMWRESE
jgi:class 3 adenylate cyclase/pimeloyl-ACP methyl ester carboxylesterase